jgi:hypothetical protein
MSADNFDGGEGPPANLAGLIGGWAAQVPTSYDTSLGEDWLEGQAQPAHADGSEQLWRLRFDEAAVQRGDRVVAGERDGELPAAEGAGFLVASVVVLDPSVLNLVK